MGSSQSIALYQRLRRLLMESDFQQRGAEPKPIRENL